jgi:hypothetical protein
MIVVALPRRARLAFSELNRHPADGIDNGIRFAGVAAMAQRLVVAAAGLLMAVIVLMFAFVHVRHPFVNS